jgi:hypothetical protein
VDGHCVRDLKLDVRHVDDQMMDVLYVDDQMLDVLCDLLLVVNRDQYVALKYVACRSLALKNENVRKLELQYFHQLAFRRAA